jgi:hypothetical protein
MEGQQLLGHELAQSCNSGKAAFDSSTCSIRRMFYKPATVSDIEVPRFCSEPHLRLQATKV